MRFATIRMVSLHGEVAVSPLHRLRTPAYVFFRDVKSSRAGCCTGLRPHTTPHVTTQHHVQRERELPCDCASTRCRGPCSIVRCLLAPCAQHWTPCAALLTSAPSAAKPCNNQLLHERRTTARGALHSYTETSPVCASAKYVLITNTDSSLPRSLIVRNKRPAQRCKAQLRTAAALQSYVQRQDQVVSCARRPRHVQSLHHMTTSCRRITCVGCADAPKSKQARFR